MLRSTQLVWPPLIINCPEFMMGFIVPIDVMSTKLYPNSQLNRSLRRNWQNPTVMFSSVTLSSYLDINCELLTVMDGYKLEYNVRKCRTSYYEFKQ